VPARIRPVRIRRRIIPERTLQFVSVVNLAIRMRAAIRSFRQPSIRCANLAVREIPPEEVPRWSGNVGDPISLRLNVCTVERECGARLASSLEPASTRCGSVGGVVIAM
jgi:hypothetical protein